MKKRAFTIAEVLISLAIVGTVAAITLPTFVTNQKRDIYSKTLASAVVNFENAMSALMMRDGVGTLFDTNAWRNVENGILSGQDGGDELRTFASNISRVFALSAVGGSVANYYNGITIRNIDGNVLGNIHDNATPFEAKGGITYFIYIASNTSDNNGRREQDVVEAGATLSNVAADVLVDINGTNNPNIVGRDIFGFVLGTDGKLYPFGGYDLAIYGQNAHEPAENACRGGDGFACTSYLMENEYRMDY